MVVAKSLDKTSFLDTDHADSTDSAVRKRKKLRPLRVFGVQRVLILDFATAMSLDELFLLRRIEAGL